MVALKRIIPELVVVINSYCHCAEYRASVLAVPDQEVNYRIVANEKTALRAVTVPGCGMARIDDNCDVNEEVRETRGFKALGVTVPRKGRRNPQQRASGVQYFRSAVEVLDALITGLSSLSGGCEISCRVSFVKHR
eukprot:Skav208722  [mRNA]  locus=scaffold615:56365:56772:- [translate_table: standard]